MPGAESAIFNSGPYAETAQVSPANKAVGLGRRRGVVWHGVRPYAGVGHPSLEYQPRRPEDDVVYRTVRDHFETFRAHAATLRDGMGLPRFVEAEFRAFLRCGWLAGGFARFRCTGCGDDRLVAFSCKGRGFCSSCGGRRMAERAAHLVDRVLPDVPVRQWVLTVPFRLRYRLAWDHDLCRAVAGSFGRVVMRTLQQRAMWRGVADGRSGAVMVIQRFGGALNLNLHSMRWSAPAARRASVVEASRRGAGVGPRASP